MENGRRRFRNVSICILGAAAIFFIYLKWDWNLVSRTPAGLWSDPGPYHVADDPGRYHVADDPGPYHVADDPGPYHVADDPGPYHVAYPRNYTYIMDDTPPCSTRTPFLVLMVHVATGDVAARDAIRKTWGSEKLVLGQPVETLFVLGLPGGADAEQQQQKLRQESLQHRDLVQSDFRDSYRNLTIKTMMMLRWLAARRGGASYAAKVDSDVLLHVRNAVRLLLDPGTARRDYLTGLVWRHSPVLRNPLSKFYMPRAAVAEPEYPAYALGMAYVLSLDLPARILAVAPRVKPIFIEDAYLGMCLRRLGSAPTDPPAGTMFIVDPRHPLSRCSLSKVIAVTTTSIPQMTGYWESSRQPDAGC